MFRAIPLGFLLSFLVTDQLAAQGKLQLVPDRQNVVATRLAGDWQSDAPLTARLGSGLIGERLPGEPPVSGKISLRCRGAGATIL